MTDDYYSYNGWDVNLELDVMELRITSLPDGDPIKITNRDDARELRKFLGYLLENIE